MSGRRPYRQVIDGVPRCPWLDPEIFRKSSSFRPAKGDIVQSTYPKSGTNWMLYITQLILRNGEEINYEEFSRDVRAIEYTDCADWKPTLPVRLFMTHLPLRREMMNEEAKYIYMARNPWDVCASMFRMWTDVSIYRFQDGKFEDFFDAFIESDLGYGDCFEHVAAGYELKDEPNVFFTTYEELKMDTKNTVLRLGHFLGEEFGRALEEDEQIIQNILEYSKVENMRKVILVELAGSETPEWNDMMTRHKVTSKHGYQGDENKFAIVKEARVGSWKEYFTPEMLVRFESKIQEKGNEASFIALWDDIHQEAITLSRVSP